MKPNPFQRKKTLESMNEDKRYPRIQGLTMAMKAIHEEPNPNEKQIKWEKIQDYILSHYILNNNSMNNRVITLNQLGTYLGLPQYKLLLKVQEKMKSMGKLLLGDNEKVAEITRVLFLRAFNFSLETASRAQNQAAILAEQQGDTYVPFLSGEVNRSIANMIGANKPLANLLEILKPNGPTQLTNPLTLEASDSKAEQEPKIGVTEALKLIQSSAQSPLSDTHLLEAQYQELGGLSLPDVGARNQDLTAIGIRKKGTDKLPNSSKPQQSLDVISDADLEDFQS